jgi:hypothetical protein
MAEVSIGVVRRWIGFFDRNQIMTVCPNYHNKSVFDSSNKQPSVPVEKQDIRMISNPTKKKTWKNIALFSGLYDWYTGK